MSKIERYLPNNQYQAAMNANVPSATNPFLTEADIPGITNKYYGSFFDTTNQNLAANDVGAMTFNNTDLSNGVSVVSNSQITVANAGVYDLQFSAQLDRPVGGGGSSANIDIWIAVNGTPVPYSNTKITMQANARYSVASWNWFLNLTAGQYVEIFWSQTDAIFLATETAGTHPGIPSVIATMSQVN